MMLFQRDRLFSFPTLFWALAVVQLLLSSSLSLYAYGQTPVSRTCGTDNKVAITETELDSPVSSFYWVGSDGKVIFALTTSNTLYKSTDDGQTWENQLPLMEGAESYPRGVRAVYRTKDPEVVYFLGFRSRLWRTEKRLNNRYIATPMSYPITRIQVHPVRSDWLLGEAMSAGCSGGSGYCYRQVLASLDFGLTWDVISTYVASSVYTWAGAGTNGIPETNVWVLEYAVKTGNQGSSGSTYVVKQSTDWFRTSIPHDDLQGVVFFLYSNGNIYLAVRSTDQIGGLHLMVSTDAGRSFKRSLFPFGDLRENQYTIIDDSAGSVFMSIGHGAQTWGNLYNSDSLSAEYDLSMQWLSKDSNGVYAFKKMSGLNGIYLGNQKQGVIGLGNGDGERTLITFDAGARWNPLDLPFNNDDTPIPCDVQPCQLNLHGTHKASSGGVNSGLYGPLHSTRNAIGVIIATGNVGDILNTELNATNTYISFDAGWKWYQIAKGSHVYELTDHGGLILMAPNSNATNKALYSWNMGNTFNECQFTDTPMKVVNIISEPSSTAKGFIVHGSRKNAQGATKGIVAHVDFSAVVPRTCDPSDYEVWSPFDSRSDPTEWKCLLGATVGYTRRKRLQECWNGNEFEQKTTPKPCPCTLEDYDCDFCYEKVDEEICSHIKDCQDDPSHNPPENCPDGYFNVSKGYRLVAGTQCFITKDLGVNLLPTRIPCEKNTGHPPGPSKKKGTIAPGVVAVIVLSVVFVVAGVLGVLLYRNRDNERLRNLVSSIPFPGGSSSSGGATHKFAPLHDDHDLGIEEIHSTHDRRTHTLDDEDDGLQDAQPLDDQALAKTIESNITLTDTNQGSQQRSDDGGSNSKAGDLIDV